MVLGVTELTFDHLRHEGIIRLFERGLNVAQVREHALCDTLETLQRCQEIACPLTCGKGACADEIATTEITS